MRVCHSATRPRPFMVATTLASDCQYLALACPKMHPPVMVQEALHLRSHGMTAQAIGDSLGIPRSTVRDWINGRIPRAQLAPDGMCSSCGRSLHRFSELPRTYVYLLGVYLGDGCISTHPRRVYRLRITLDAAYPNIIDEVTQAVSSVCPANRVGEVERLGYVEVYSFSKSWPCLFPQHGPGKKHLRPIRLSDWQEDLVRAAPHLLVRGLIHSDGCRFVNTGRGWRYPRYSFTNLSEDIRRIFTEACDLMGLRWTTAGPKVYVSRKADVDRLDQLVGPKT
jgi:hypothetical protein